MTEAKTVRKRVARRKPTLPDREDMERFLASIGDRKEQVNRAAQELVYDAWDQTTQRARIALARKALRVSPLCADAYNILADQQAKTHAGAYALHALALHAATLSLGPDFLKKYAGELWGRLDARGYMRARAGMAYALMQAGRLDEAVVHLRALLKLNPRDNQGNRYRLMICLLRRDDRAGLKALFRKYRECSVYWLYTQALIAYRDNGPSDSQARALALAARSINPHVAGILAGMRKPGSYDDGYVTFGSADEATEYIDSCGDEWRRTPGAVAWLVNLLKTMPRLDDIRGSGTRH